MRNISRRYFLTSKPFLTVVILLVLFSSPVHMWGQTMSMSSRFAQLNQLAQLAQTSDPDAIQNVVSEMFVIAGLQGHLPSTIQGRVVQAEIAYRHQQREAISVSSIVTQLNRLADTFNLPSYARTSAKQVRAVRMCVLTMAPELGAQSFKISQGTISEQMSPMEAAFVGLMLISQKLNNPSLQVDPAEWDSVDSQPAVELPPSGTKNVLTSRTGSRRQELLQAVNKATATLDPVTLAQLASDALNQLGF